ncbi:hypothetical protein ACL03H_12010 [Saccharopolyspora sp. MS10]|uniref:hypothetical protein n=1 Tax=Saccharopolyspora sp. MS10 TaxID=3385973 RepID=UPI0039A24F01
MIPIPTGPPPPPRLLPVSVEWERSRKLRLLIAGIALMTGSPVVVLVGMAWMFVLPAGGHPLAWIAVLMIGVSGLFSWLLGLCTLLGQRYFRGGTIDVAGARPLLRQSVVLCAGTACANGLGLAVLSLVFFGRADEVNPELLIYLLVVAVPMVMAVIACPLMFKSLRPEPRF